ncbi:hypothetical protein EOA60_10495 [Mesorhizobium sp. M1A.F.Ca.IN.020.06.1.1]|uniref:hypothetical protein n=1 Tax=unclassified Mesorhizobium TaxID=325217 RepID=UPI000FCC1589|nr:MULTISPECIES: hypothetical protein [unclassified Mesorhizobium]RUV82294.1 hypothetical protein EOA51_28920 [Mesorhizobium sp. M1A.F.Ca.IN.020.32.1.1]RUW06779.1 hypothetical protein EOA46_25220 [Mesorhizobium sp. M1A.F.Ca.IN.022.05.2.1]RUW31917.1 hypothetical protein EOA60_10495 [Mesorhizobium sp. M1A.F.Ca.IN.020.06.1.1]RWF75662.1 MAG: hypothetical protein EOQ35_28225 [Mesorhizobium sp.]RWF95458.1 MAG: hypothetical protein EOQ38_26480 [Mesorhizobium sp.]
MNFREIQDRLIGAETIMRELSEGRVGPAPLRAQQLPYIHTRTDMNGWGKRPGETDKLRKEDGDAHAIFRREFWEQFQPDPSPAEVSRAIAEKDWILLVDNEAERRALQAWVRAQAGGQTFARWCKRIENIHPETGRRRKNRAIEKILAQLSSKSNLHDEIAGKPLLPVGPEIADISATIPDGVSGRETGPNSWAADEAFQPISYARIEGTKRVEVEGDFSWSQKRNELRRLREARRKKKMAAQAR